MIPFLHRRLRLLPPLALVLLATFFGEDLIRAGGVTVITHGFNGNVTDWVIPMANKIAQNRALPGTACSIYRVSITQNSKGNYAIVQTFLSGANPQSADSGEIIVALDWSTLSGLFGPSTSEIATQATAALFATNLIPELNGRPLAELPLHLAGHSRGASVMAEVARLLGAQGVWVDHLTTLDPYPLSLNGDPAMKNFANVLFADNYWQETDFPTGQSITGAYNRYLTQLGGGYAGGSAHSDVHLWYHGTIDLATPTSDALATITTAERAAWWAAPEAAGTNCGFLYSRIGGGDRLSTIEPAGRATGAIRSGYNQLWDLGAGLSANRSALPGNNGAWPNLLRFDVTQPNQLRVGDPIPMSFYYQSGSSTSGTATVRVWLDRDHNPYNGNETELFHAAISNTSPSAVFATSGVVNTSPTNTLPGAYSLFAKISDGVRTRYLYAPQPLVLGPSRQAPTLTTARIATNHFRLTIAGFPGQTFVLQASTNFTQWASLQTNTLSGTALDFIDPELPSQPRRFYRALLMP